MLAWLWSERARGAEAGRWSVASGGSCSFEGEGRCWYWELYQVSTGRGTSRTACWIGGSARFTVGAGASPVVRDARGNATQLSGGPGQQQIGEKDTTAACSIGAGSRRGERTG